MSVLYRSPVKLGIPERAFGVEEYHASKELAAYVDNIVASDFTSTQITCPDILEGIPQDQLKQTFTGLADTILKVTMPLEADYGSTGSNDKAKSIRRQLTYAAARFIVQTNQFEATEPHPSTIPKNTPTPAEKHDITMDRLLRNVELIPDIADSLETFDIPTYRKLFEEYDQLHLASPDGITEAYMGRDGIFAYFARLGQLASRGDLDPLSFSIGKVAPHRPRYLVLSSRIKYYHYKELLKQYIDQTIGEGCRDVHAYDTGYVGSVPEALLRHLKIPHSEYDNRVHLMSSRVSTFFRNKRQIHGGQAYGAVGVVEAYSQLTTSASRLSRLGEAVVFEANATTPADNFNFVMRRHMLYTYFMKRERNMIQELLTNGMPEISSRYPRQTYEVVSNQQVPIAA